MSREPFSVAAGHNPILSTLVTGLNASRLGNTLDRGPITVFAPDNDAFASLPATTVRAAMADPRGRLSAVLSNHVVRGRLSPDRLAGTHQTLNAGHKLTVTGTGTNVVIDGQARVVCGNVQTANATVYIIDHVLLPKS